MMMIFLSDDEYRQLSDPSLKEQLDKQDGHWWAEIPDELFYVYLVKNRDSLKIRNRLKAIAAIQDENWQRHLWEAERLFQY